MRVIVIAFLIMVNVNLIHGGTENDSLKNLMNPQAVKAKMQIREGTFSGKFRKEDGPFLLTGSIIVPSGQILEFGPGCEIFIGGEYSAITVFGLISIHGSEAEPVHILSAKSAPNPWDWDRIYCRSSDQSFFEHCSISHSNYGITAENGNVIIKNCTFTNNSLNALQVMNSEVTIENSNFTGGHAVAINLKNGAVVTAENLTVKDNKTAIACESKSVFKLTGGIISNNVSGIITDQNAAVSIIATNITKNRYGVVTTVEIPRRLREMVFNNYNDIRVVTNVEFAKVTKEPQNVHMVTLPQKKVSTLKNSSFPYGFSALSVPRELNSSFIGNVISGFTVYKPTSLQHPLDKDSVGEFPYQYIPVTRKQTKYPGEQTDAWYGGIQPELQVFANGKRGSADINLIMDVYGNDWLSTSNYFDKNIFNLTMSYSQKTLTFGDFYENGSETSIPGRQMTGLKFTGGFLEMGDGVKRIDLKLSAGETEIPKDSGDHELNIFNVKVDTGQSIRQQISYLASLTYRPLSNAVISAKGIIARDQANKPLLRIPITDPAVKDPIAAQTGILDASVMLLDDKIELTGEIDLGTFDTIAGNAAKDIAWYNPQIDKAVPEVFNLFKNDEFKEHYASTIGVKTKIRDYTSSLNYMQIAKNYFSAGNPYLETDRRKVVLNIEKSILKKIMSFGEASYERTFISSDLVDRGELNISSEYRSENSLPDYTIGYTGRIERNKKTERDSFASVTFNSTQLSSIISAETKQTLKNGISYSLRYQILFDEDLSDHPFAEYNKIGNRWQNTWNAALVFKTKRFIRNKSNFRFATKNENRDSLRAISYKVGDQLYIDLIKSKLSLKLSGDYSAKKEKKFLSTWQAPVNNDFYSSDIEVKYSISQKLSLTLNGGYEKSYDETSGSTENYNAATGGFHVTCLF